MNNMNAIRRPLVAAMVMAAGLTAAADTRTLLELPVSVVSNKLYLSSMTERPWWNEAWTKRVPLLVSGQADVADEKVVVDTIVDFGEPVKPEDVRVVTPWETEVPCVAERVESKSRVEVEERKDSTLRLGLQTSTSLRLIFQTRLRIHENRPFLVYYNRQGEDALATKNGADCGKGVPALAEVQLAETESTFRLRNGVVDVVFDRNHVTESLIRSLRISGSSCKTVLFDMANGYAKGGFKFQPNAKNGWDRGAVVLDTPLAKSVRFDCADATVTFTLYADQPRVDWTYVLKGCEQASIHMNWGIGTGTSWDDFFYCGKSGKILTQRAGLDWNTDCEACPEGRFENWLGEGWYAFGERRMADIAGLVFDVKALSHVGYDSYYGNGSTLTLRHVRSNASQPPYRGSGAIVATLGNVEDFRKIAKRIEKPVLVSIGKPQDKVVKLYRIPRLDRDWCCDHNAGYMFGGDSGTAEPLAKDPVWARTVCERLRSYGSTTVCVLGYPWWMMPIKDKSIYDRLLAIQKSGAFESWVNDRKNPTWEEMQKPEQGFGILQYTKAIHDFGMGVHTWCGEVPGWSTEACVGKFMPELNDLAVDIMSERVREGQDCAYSNAIEGEGVALPKDLVKKNGSSSYWSWKNPQEAFDAFDRQHVMVRDFYTKFKAKHPDIPVFLWNSENGEIGREKFMSEDEGYFDTMVVEFCPQNFQHVKHVAKRMRSHFNNVPGKTVWHHYYIMNPRNWYRIHEVEWPFVCGVNGFSQENLSYETKDLEMSEITADFFRFAEYTRLGEKVAKMGPVKNLGVYRDPKAFREDVIKGRLKKPYPYDAQQDGRCRSFGELRNFNYDVIGPKFFMAKDLAQYKVVYVPEDDVISEDEVKELLEYVKNGGSAIIEGVMGSQGGDALATKNGTTDRQGGDALATKNGTQCGKGVLALAKLGLKDSVITPYGKGKILWYKEVKTDRIAKGDSKVQNEVRKAIADMGGVEPFAFKGESGLDGNLQVGPEGAFLAFYNEARETRKGTVTLGEKLKLKVEVEERNDKFHSSPSPSTFTSYYVLDVKNGTRVLVTNNTFAVSCGAQQCAYYLIGDDAFTAIPETRDCVWAGASASSERPSVRTAEALDLTGFKPTVVVEFTRGNDKGEPWKLPRTAIAKYVSRGFTPKSYDAKAVQAALAETKFVNFVDYDQTAADRVFADCGEQLKDVLKRGGTIMLSRTSTGPAAQAFLKSVDVFDPNPSAKTGIGDTWAMWCGPEDHPYLSADTVASAKEPEVSGSREWWHWKGLCNYFQYGRVFAQWDAAKQQRLFMPKNDGEKYAALVIQEKVLGTGRVIFNENQRSYTSFYETASFVNNFAAYILGEKPEEHAKKMTQFNGGPSDIYVETRTKGW